MVGWSLTNTVLTQNLSSDLASSALIGNSLLALFAQKRQRDMVYCNSIPTLILEDVMIFPNPELLCIGAFITN